MTITYAAERFPNFIGELKALASKHYAETGGYHPRFEERIDYEAYAEMDRLGVLLSVIARDSARDGSPMVGYFGGCQHVDMHSGYDDKPILAVTQMLIYVLPEYRVRAARGLIRAVERIAAAKGCTWIALGDGGRKRTGDFFRAIGYVPRETTHVKVL